MRCWLFRITSKHRIDMTRRRSSAACTLDEEAFEQQEDETAVDPSLAAEEVDRLEQAHGVLRRFPESLRSVFVLYEVNRLRYREIAEALDVPINTVKVRLLRARQELARLVRKEEPWPIPSRK